MLAGTSGVGATPVVDSVAAQPSESPAENPADLLVDALESPDVTDEELDAVDASLDAMVLQESGPGMNSSKSLLSIEEAQAKLSPEILEVLSKKFKGSLTETRHLDERDQIF